MEKKEGFLFCHLTDISSVAHCHAMSFNLPTQDPIDENSWNNMVKQTKENKFTFLIIYRGDQNIIYASLNTPYKLVKEEDECIIELRKNPPKEDGHYVARRYHE